MVLHSQSVVFCRGGLCAAMKSGSALSCGLLLMFVLFSTDRASHGTGAGCFPQHTQETGYMSAGAGRHGCREHNAV